MLMTREASLGKRKPGDNVFVADFLPKPCKPEVYCKQYNNKNGLKIEYF